MYPGPDVRCPTTMFWVVEMVTTGPGDDKWDAIIALHFHPIHYNSLYYHKYYKPKNKNDFVSKIIAV